VIGVDLASVQSRESQRFEAIREQGFDSSCGYASVASLLDLYWNYKTSELDLLTRESGRAGNHSLSLAQVRRLLELSGFEAKGYRMSFQQLAAVAKLYAPILVHYDRPQKHFALLLGVEGDQVVTADPARGVEVLSADQFLARWSGAALFVANREAVRNLGRIETVVDGALARHKLLARIAREP
jgi:predicted double-glycine peptidase